MKLTPVEFLAEHCEVASIDSSITIYLDRLDYGTTTEQTFIASVSELEQLRQAIISDFVNGLDAVGWKLFDEFYHSHDEAKSGGRNWTVQPTPLFDLSEWRNK